MPPPRRLVVSQSYTIASSNERFATFFARMGGGEDEAAAMDMLDHSEKLARQAGYTGVDQAAAEITGVDQPEDLDQAERGLLVCDLQDLLAYPTLTRPSTRTGRSSRSADPPELVAPA